MQINLSLDQRAFVDSLVRTGRIASVDEAVSESIRVWTSSERLRGQVALGID